MAALVLLPTLVICWPEAVNWIARKNIAGEVWLGKVVLSRLVDEEILDYIGMAEKFKNGADAAIRVALSFVPENKRAYVEVALHLKAQWRTLVAEELVLLLLLRLVLRGLRFRWLRRKRLERIEPTFGERGPNLRLVEPPQLPRGGTLPSMKELRKIE